MSDLNFTGPSVRQRSSLDLCGVIDCLQLELSFQGTDRTFAPIRVRNPRNQKMFSVSARFKSEVGDFKLPPRATFDELQQALSQKFQLKPGFKIIGLLLSSPFNMTSTFLIPQLCSEPSIKFFDEFFGEIKKCISVNRGRGGKCRAED